MIYVADSNEQKKMTLKNTFDKKIMFKIKCSDNVLYM